MELLTLQAPSPAPQPARCRCGRYVGSIGIVLLDEHGRTIDARPRCEACFREGQRRRRVVSGAQQLRMRLEGTR